MKQAHLLVTLNIHAYSQRRKAVNPKKIYVIDTSILNLLPQKLDTGRKMENLVFIELMRRKTPTTSISYYKLKTNQEIDFIISEMNKIKQLIEVTYNLEKIHIEKTLKAMENLKLKKATKKTWNEEKTIKQNNKEIKVTPLWKWLLK